MPFWLMILKELLPSIIGLIMQILELLKDRPKAMQETVKDEIRSAIKERRWDKIQAILDRYKSS